MIQSSQNAPTAIIASGMLTSILTVMTIVRLDADNLPRDRRTPTGRLMIVDGPVRSPRALAGVASAMHAASIHRAIIRWDGEHRDLQSADSERVQLMNENSRCELGVCAANTRRAERGLVPYPSPRQTEQQRL